MELTRKEAKEYVIKNPKVHLRPAKKNGTYICPLCNNGTGPQGDGITTKDGIHFTCFRCHEISNNDIIDIIGLEYGIAEDKDKFEKAYELYGIDVIQDNSTAADIVNNFDKSEHNKEIVEPVKKYDFYFQIDKAHKELLSNNEALSYFYKRGITKETIEKFKIGYAEQGHNSILQDYPELKTSSMKAGLYKYIFPVLDGNNACSYFRSEIIDRSQIDDYNAKYRLINGIPSQLFNAHYLKSESEEPIFLTEGIYDALSVEQAGYKAIGGIGTNHRAIIDSCKNNGIKDTIFIIGLDNDGAGQDAIKRLKEGFDNLGIMYIEKPAANGKDYNEALQIDRDSFYKFISDSVTEALNKHTEAEQEEIDAYLQSSAYNQIEAFKQNIKDSIKRPYYSTGLKALDNLIDGGITNGLYCVGAISSLGKTTFCLQIADNIAMQGQDVLIFSLEMSRNELMAKSISRETMAIDLADNKTTQNAKTTLGILKGSRYADYSDTEKEVISKAIEKYKGYSKNIYIIEGVGNIDVKAISDIVNKHIKYTGKKPVIMVDYLQILATYTDEQHPNKTFTDKQATDKSILELKRISRELPVIAISSFNRESYTEPVALSSFKESGCIEYTSDVLIGLQYSGMEYTTTSKADKNGNNSIVRESSDNHKARVRELIEKQEQRAKDKQAQQIEVKILKNRNGVRGKADLLFYPFFNCYTDTRKDGFSLITGMQEREVKKVFKI